MSNDSAADPLHGVVLLPCPFCGGNARIEEGFDIDCESTTATIYCTGCEAMFGPEYPDDIGDVVEFMGRWNNRVSPEFICNRCSLRQDAKPKVEPQF